MFKNLYTSKLDLSKSCPITQFEWTIVKANYSHPIIRTPGVGPCVAVAIFYEDKEDNSKNIAALAHFFDTKYKAFEHILKLLKQVDNITPEKLKVSIIGGWNADKQSKTVAKSVLKFFKDQGCLVNTEKMFIIPKELQNQDHFLNNNIQVASIDARDGSLFITLDERKEYYFEYDYLINKGNWMDNLHYTHLSRNQLGEVYYKGPSLYFNCECDGLTPSELTSCKNYQSIYNDIADIND